MTRDGRERGPVEGRVRLEAPRLLALGRRVPVCPIGLETVTDVEADDGDRRDAGPVGETPVRAAATVRVPAGEMPMLVGSRDGNLRSIETRFGVRLVPGDGAVMVFGEQIQADRAAEALDAFMRLLRSERRSSSGDLDMVMRAVSEGGGSEVAGALTRTVAVTHRKKPVRPKTVGQARYVEAVGTHDLVFCIGPAGTGKTFLAMAMAIEALKAGDVSRIVLTRPIVEAGEQLGFLPGDMLEKVEPYLAPLHDALADIAGFDRVQRLQARGVIEVMPLAYMRGRTINDAIMVLDEAQNTTVAQMKMFLTRMGFGSKMIVTGDVTQTDLPADVECGLINAVEVLERVDGVAVCRLDRSDIVRHALVQRIVDAYENRSSQLERQDTEPPPQH